MTLTFCNISSPRLRDFIFSDGERDVARIYKSDHQKDWTWSVFLILPARAGKTHGHELDPKEARVKVEAAWAYAKAHGEPAGELCTCGNGRDLLPRLTYVNDGQPRSHYRPSRRSK